MSYVRIGKYCFSSSNTATSVNATSVNLTIGNARTLARNLGTGYQLHDWKIHKLVQDLSILDKQTVVISTSSILGIEQVNKWVLIDGISVLDGQWLCAYNPEKYADSPTSNTEGYNSISYSCPTVQGKMVKKLGYDTNNPFFSFASDYNDTNNTYYSSPLYSYGTASRVCLTNIGNGLYYSNNNNSFNNGDCNRLCYRPIEE